MPSVSSVINKVKKEVQIHENYLNRLINLELDAIREKILDNGIKTNKEEILNKFKEKIFKKKPIVEETQLYKEIKELLKNPDLKDKVVGLIQTEHLGEMDYKEVNGQVLPTGYTEQSYLWTRNNEYLISSAKEALDRFGSIIN